MSDDTGRRLLVSTFLVAVALLTWNEMKVNKVMPRPQRYVGAGVIWALLALLSPVLTYSLSGMFSVGVVLMLLYKNVSSSSGSADQGGSGLGGGGSVGGGAGGGGGGSF